MAAGDISLRTSNPNPLALPRLVAAGGISTINNGEPTKTGAQISSTGFYVAPMVDGNGTSSQEFAGIAKSVSTDTAAADGSLQVFLPTPGIIYAAKALSAAAVDTPIEVNQLVGKRVVFDLTAGVWTVDTAAGTATTNNVVVVGGDYTTSTVFFVYDASGTWIG